MVGYMMRFHPAINKIKYLIKKNYIGKIYYIYSEWGEYLPNWHQSENYKKSYAAKKNSGGSLTLFNPSSTTYVKHFISNASTMTYHTGDTDTGNYNYAMYVAGYGNTTSAINAVRFQMSSGNFDGVIKLYGVKKS